MVSLDSVQIVITDGAAVLARVKITGEPNTVEFEMEDNSVTLPYDPATVVSALFE